MIFSIDTSSTLYGFDQNSKSWSEYTANTAQDWVSSYGGGNVCMLLNDSVAVAYSSVLSQFSELRFEGTRLTLPGSGWTSCDENTGVFMTTERIYVYDALVNTWTSTVLNDYSILTGYGNHIRDDFMYINLAFSDGNMRIIAYSLITKTIAQITKENFPIRRLDHGLCILGYSSSTYIAGYSAFTGVFTEITTSAPGEEFFDSSPATDNEKVSEVILQMFHKRSALEVDGNVTLTTYVYNTLTGQFYSHSYTYRYVSTGFFIKVGGKFTAMAMYDITDYEVTLHIFRASDNSFYTLDVPIQIIASSPGCLTVGKDVFWIWDDTYIIAVNAITGATGQMSLGDSFATLPPVQATMAGDDWGIWAYRNTESDIVKIYYFSGDVTSIGYREVQASLGVSEVQSAHMGFMMFQNPGNYKKWSAYSPSHNSWHDFESTTSTSDYQTVPGNYGYVNYYSKNRLELFDAVTNEVRIYPHFTSFSYSINKENHLTVYNSAKQYIGYSAVEHDDKLYQADKYYGLLGVDDISVITPTGTLLTTYTRIIYDGYRNNLAGLKIADSLGTSVNGYQKGKFCFFATITGHIFAYTGDEGSLVSVEQNSMVSPAEYSLDQNYPNPFNPTTEIRFSVKTNDHISLRVYDMLGREVAVLVNEKKPAGSYKVQWEASGFSSGVYFYKLSLGKYMCTKKMLLVK